MCTSGSAIIGSSISLPSPPFLGNSDFTVDLGGATGTTAYLVVASGPTLYDPWKCSSLLIDWLYDPFTLPVPVVGGQASVPVNLLQPSGILPVGAKLYFQYVVASGSCTSLTDAIEVTLLRP